MANKTQPTAASVEEFLAAVANDRRRSDAREVHQMMATATGETAVMWGASMVGFGIKPYRTAAGRTGDWFLIGFAPRKANLVLYFTTDHDPALLARLGKHKRGVGCMYVNKLDDIDRSVLHELVVQSVAKARAPG